ncbi:MAG: hypothetical protein AAF638_06545 [Pseudomonadota bacterium]
MSEMLGAIAKIVVIVFVSLFGFGDAPDNDREQPDASIPSVMGWMR